MPYYPPTSNPSEQQQQQQQQQEQEEQLEEQEISTHHNNFLQRRYLQRSYQQMQQQSYQTVIPPVGIEPLQYLRGMNDHFKFQPTNPQPLLQYEDRSQQQYQAGFSPQNQLENFLFGADPNFHQQQDIRIPTSALINEPVQCITPLPTSVSNGHQIQIPSNGPNINCITAPPTTTMQVHSMQYATEPTISPYSNYPPQVQINYDVYHQFQHHHSLPQIQTTSVDSGVGLSTTSSAMFLQPSPSSAHYSIEQTLNHDNIPDYFLDGVAGSSSTHDNIPSHPLEGVAGPSSDRRLGPSQESYAGSPQDELNQSDNGTIPTSPVEKVDYIEYIDKDSKKRFRCLLSSCDRTAKRRVDMARHIYETHVVCRIYACSDDPLVWERIGYYGPGCVRQEGGCGKSFKRKEHYKKHLQCLRKEDKKSGRKPAKKEPDTEDQGDGKPDAKEKGKGRAVDFGYTASSSSTAQKASGEGNDSCKGRKRKANYDEELSLISRMSRSFTSLSLSSRSKSPKSPAKSSKKTDMSPPQRITSKRRKHAKA